MKAILHEAVEKGASDLHITVGLPPTLRWMGKLVCLGQTPLTASDTETLAASLMTQDQETKLYEHRELDFTYALEDTHRFRVNIYFQRGHVAVAVRMIPQQIPTPEEIELTPEVIALTHLKNGLVLVTGPTGSGKSTTLAAMINHINKNHNKHIITIEDPIEFVYNNEKSMINQREDRSVSIFLSRTISAASRRPARTISGHRTTASATGRLRIPIGATTIRRACRWASRTSARRSCGRSTSRAVTDALIRSSCSRLRGLTRAGRTVGGRMSATAGRAGGFPATVTTPRRTTRTPTFTKNSTTTCR